MPNATQIPNQTREQARNLTGFDFSAPAELFPSRNKNGHGRIAYKRFDTAAEAIRYSIEDMPGAALLGAYLQSEDTRLHGQEIRALYDSAAYPLERRAAAG